MAADIYSVRDLVRNAMYICGGRQKVILLCMRACGNICGFDVGFRVTTWR